MRTLSHPNLDLIEQALVAAGESAPDTVEALLSLPHIKIFTDALKAYEGPNESRLFRATASSTIKDLHGDVMTEECVRDMSVQARKGPTGNGLTIFLNHSYKVPEDIAGKVIGSQVLTRDNDEVGLPIWDMDYEIQLAKGPAGGRLDQTWSLIRDEQITLGLSIGAYILEYDFIDKEEGFWGGLIINKVLLVETSIVGIPANQRSWIQNGVIAIGKSLGYEEKQIRRVLDQKEAAPLMKTNSITTTTADNIGITTPSTTVLNGITWETTEPPVVIDTIETPSDEPSPEVTAAAPETESTDEQPTETTDETQSGETTEEVVASDSPALADVAPEVALSLEAGTTPALELVLAALERASETVRELRAEKATLELQVKGLTGERDQAIQDRNDAAEIIALVARSPLGRKTQFAAPVQSFQARFGAIYDSAFLKLLDETE